jgi:hypothetical protein
MKKVTMATAVAAQILYWRTPDSSIQIDPLVRPTHLEISTRLGTVARDHTGALTQLIEAERSARRAYRGAD